MVLLEFSMYPISRGESVSRYVARSLEIIERSGLDYRLHAMGTVLEGEWGECMAVVEACYEAMRRDCGRVECVIKIDYRKGRRGRLRSKVASVEKRLGRKLKTA
jgi:uncharacterized protein (TIGR00106 family)